MRLPARQLTVSTKIANIVAPACMSVAWLRLSTTLPSDHHAARLVRQKDRRLWLIRNKAVDRGLDILPPAAGIIVDDDESAGAHARIEEIQGGRHRLAQIAID